MADGLALLQLRLTLLARGGRRDLSRTMAPALKAVVRARFDRGAAPVESGALRDGCDVRVGAEGLRVVNPLPYAKFHPELLPEPQELEQVLGTSARAVLDGYLRGIR